MKELNTLTLILKSLQVAAVGAAVLAAYPSEAVLLDGQLKEELQTNLRPV